MKKALSRGKKDAERGVRAVQALGNAYGAEAMGVGKSFAARVEQMKIAGETAARLRRKRLKGKIDMAAESRRKSIFDATANFNKLMADFANQGARIRTRMNNIE